VIKVLSLKKYLSGSLRTLNVKKMKKKIKSIFVAGIFFLFPLFVLTQSPPHPNGGNEPGSGNTPVGGGAPIGEGLILLISLGIGYGVKKYRQIKKVD